MNVGNTFNGYGELVSQTFTVSGNAAMQWPLTRDNAGRITQKIETIAGASSSYGYSYDSMGLMLTVSKDGSVVESYGYDLNGTRISETNLLRGGLAVVT